LQAYNTLPPHQPLNVHGRPCGRPHGQPGHVHSQSLPSQATGC
jgi:hypothetical protein